MDSNPSITPGSGRKQGNPNILRYIAYFMLLASCVLIVLGVYFYQKEDKFLSECKLLKCRITNIEEKLRGHAIITFKEVNGNYPPFGYIIDYDASESDLSYKVNEIHEIYYYEKDVSKSEIKGFFENHSTSFILIIIGFAFMLDFPILLLVTSRIKKQREANQQFGIKDTVISE
jgi:hypothetical protein